MKRITSKKLSLSRVQVANLTSITGGAEDGTDTGPDSQSAPRKSQACAKFCGGEPGMKQYEWVSDLNGHSDA